jgi:hypothetical protein
VKFWDLNEDPGSGNLNLRAYIASLVGPRRIAHARRTVYRVHDNKATQIAKNGSGTKSVFYVEAWTPQQAGGGGLVNFLFSNSQDAVGETGVAVSAVPGQIVSLTNYRAILLPGENLYVQLGPQAVGVLPPQPLVVAEVHF